MSHRIAFQSAAVVILGTLGVVFGCSDEAQPLELAEVYELMLAGMTEDGLILHTTESLEVADDQGVVVATGETELWIDVANDTYRREQRFFDNPEFAEPLVWFYARGSLYNQDGSVLGPFAEEGAVISSAPGTCSGGNSTLLHGVLECAKFALYTLEDLAPEIERSRTPDGADSFRIRFTLGPISDEGALAVSDLHVDPDSFLPLVRVTGIESPDGVRHGEFETYQHEFIPRQDLPIDFLDPT